MEGVAYRTYANAMREAGQRGLVEPRNARKDGDAVLFAQHVKLRVQSHGAAIQQGNTSAKSFDITHVMRREDDAGSFAVE